MTKFKKNKPLLIYLMYAPVLLTLFFILINKVNQCIQIVLYISYIMYLLGCIIIANLVYKNVK